MAHHGFPVITLEVAGMRASVRTALTEYLADLSSEVQAAVDRACTPEHVQQVIDVEVEKTLRDVIAEEVERFYRSGEGRQKVREAVAEKLRDVP